MSFATSIRSQSKSAKSRFPGAADADLGKFVLLQVKVALDNPGRTVKDEELAKLADLAFEEAVEAGEAWAVSLKNSYRDHVIKPLVDKAREKGVDPVPAIVMQTDLTEEQATAMVADLDAVNDEESDEEFGLNSLNTSEDDALAPAV